MRYDRTILGGEFLHLLSYPRLLHLQGESLRACWKNYRRVTHGQQLFNLRNLGISLVEFGQGGGRRPYGRGWDFCVD